MLSVYLLSHGRRVRVVPQPLQIRRLPARPARPDQQVAPELEHQRHQRRIAARRELRDPLVGRQFGRVRVPEVDRHPAEQLLMIRDVLGAQRRIALLPRRRERRRDPRMRVGRYVPVVLEIGRRRQDQRDARLVAARSHTAPRSGSPRPGTPPSIDSGRRGRLVRRLHPRVVHVAARDPHHDHVRRIVREHLAPVRLAPATCTAPIAIPVSRSSSRR